MRVRMLTSLAGQPSYHQGDIVDIDPGIAKAWIQARIAEAVREEDHETTEARRGGEQAVTRRRAR